jgi:hypothetical protein
MSETKARHAAWADARRKPAVLGDLSGTSCEDRRHLAGKLEPSRASVERYLRAMDAPKYPDISKLLAIKAKGRRARADLSFAEKLAILDKLREAAAEFAALRKGAAQKTEQ